VPRFLKALALVQIQQPNASTLMSDVIHSACVVPISSTQLSSMSAIGTSASNVQQAHLFPIMYAGPHSITLSEPCQGCGSARSQSTASQRPTQ
jgi:hypothetical protein